VQQSRREENEKPSLDGLKSSQLCGIQGKGEQQPIGKKDPQCRYRQIDAGNRAGCPINLDRFNRSAVFHQNPSARRIRDALNFMINIVKLSIYSLHPKRIRGAKDSTLRWSGIRIRAGGLLASKS
jgi:hypothetical protein